MAPEIPFLSGVEIEHEPESSRLKYGSSLDQEASKVQTNQYNPLVEHHVPYAVQIIDGMIKIDIREFGLRITAKVVQTKGSGTADADTLTKPTDAHLEILNILVNINERCSFKANQIIKWINVQRVEKGKPLINSNGIRRPISELYRKNAIFKRSQDRYGIDYSVNTDYVKKILETNKF